MAEIYVMDENDDNIFVYLSDVIPRNGELLTVQDNKDVYRVDSVEHYIRKHGGTRSLISPGVIIRVVMGASWVMMRWMLPLYASGGQ